MKRKITFLIATAIMLFLNLFSWHNTAQGQERGYTKIYTLDGTESGTGTTYNEFHDNTQNGITWSIMGNINNTPWRIGGKKGNGTGSATDRPLYSKGAISANVSKIEVTHGNGTITVNSMTLIVSTAQNGGGTVISTISGTYNNNGTTTFTRPADKDWTGRYYKIIYNVVNNTNTQKFVLFSKAEFYKDTYTLTYSATSGGSIISVTNGSTPVSSGASLDPGTTLNIVAEATSGNIFNEWTYTGTGSSVANPSEASTTFTLGTENATLTANFVSAGEYITVNPSSPETVSCNGDNLEFTLSTNISTPSFGIKYYDASTEEEISKPEMLGTVGFDNNTLNIEVNENIGAARSVKFKVYSGTTYSSIVTINQSAFSVDAPTFNIDEGTYYEDQSVTINAVNGATIYYTLDGTDPTTSSSVYSTAISITSTKTLKAFARKNNTNSTIASATYTIIHPITIAEARAVTLNNSATTRGIVTYISGKNAYIQDETAAICLYKSSANWNASSTELTVLDDVVVTGTLDKYTSGGNLIEIKNPTITKMGEVINLPYITKTIAEIKTDNYDDLQCLRVQIEGAKVVSYSTPNGSVKQGANTINIYTANLGLAANDKITFKGIVDYYNSALQLKSIDGVSQLPAVVPNASLNAFSYVAGNGPSASQSFSFSGKNLGNNDLTVSVSSDYEMSVNNGNEWSTITEKTYTPTAGAVASTTLYVRLKSGLSAGDHNGTITISAGGDEETIALTGSVTPSNLFTIVVNPANSGSVDSEVVSGSYVAAGTEIIVAADAEDGYKFSSWSVSGEGSSVADADDYMTTFTMGTADATLTANFVPTYEITYAAMTNGSVTADPNPAAENDEVTLIISPSSGYALKTLSVYKTDGGTPTIEVTNNKFTMPAYGVTVAATFDTEYTIVYDANGGTGDDVEVNYAAGDNAEIEANGFTAPDCKQFVNWNDDPDGNGTSYEPGDVITGIDDDYILYAQWETIEYTVTYNVNGNTTVVPEETVDCGEEIDLPDATLEPLSHLGWSETPGGSLVDDPYEPDDDVTLYAVFGSVSSNALTINGNTTNIPTSYGSGTWTISSISFSQAQIMQETESGTKVIQFKKSSAGYLYNTTKLNLISLQITTVSGELTVYEGTSNNPGTNSITPTLSDGVYTYTFSSNKNYFKIINTTSNAIRAYTIVINYEDIAPVTITNVTGIETIAEPITSSDCIIVKKDAVLTLNAANNGTAANLVIEDGGQLIANSSVAATFKKSMTAPSKVYGWDLISSPVHDGTSTTIAVGNVTNLTTGSYDMFAYDEDDHMWRTQKKEGGAAGFTTLNKGEGYMYRNGGNELIFEGNTNTGTFTRDLTYTAGDLAGFHLVGNPYTHSITVKDNVTLLDNESEALESGKQLSGYYLLTNGGSEWTAKLDADEEISNKQGFLIQIPADAKKIQFSTGAKKDRANADNIMFTIANSQSNDVAYALFDNALGLNKINHRDADAPMLYIPQNGENYAIATMSDDTKSFNLNFKPMTTGKYTLSVKANGNYSYLHIIDRLTGEDVDMLLEGEYSFIGAPNDNENRFIVKLNYNAGNSLCDDEIFAFQNGSDIIVNGNGELQIFDITGRSVMTTTINGVETIQVPTTGVLIFRLIGSEVKTQKIVVE